MANVDAPMGFKPVKHLNGNPWNGAVTPMYINAAYESSGVFIGDLIVKVAAGSNTASITVPGAGEFSAGTLPAIQRATLASGNFVSGVVVAMAAVTADSVVYAADLTERIAFVCTDPSVVFEVQAEGTLTDTMVGLNGLAIETHAGSTVTGMSGLELDCGTGTAPGADDGYMLLIHGQKNSTDNDTNAANSQVLVSLNLHSDTATGDGSGALGI